MSEERYTFVEPVKGCEVVIHTQVDPARVASVLAIARSWHDGAVVEPTGDIAPEPPDQD